MSPIKPILILVILTSGYISPARTLPDSAQHVAVLRTTPAEPTTVFRTFESLPETVYNETSDPILIPITDSDDSIAYHRARAKQLHEEVTSKNSFINNILDAATLTLPVGIVPQNGDLNYAIIISKAEVNDEGTFVDVYLLFVLPNTGDSIAFRGKNIAFSNDGGFTGAGRLELVGDYPIKLNDKTLAWLLGKGNSYVEFDCNGFKGMGIEAEVEFSRDWIIPEDITIFCFLGVPPMPRAIHPIGAGLSATSPPTHNQTHCGLSATIPGRLS